MKLFFPILIGLLTSSSLLYAQSSAPVSYGKASSQNTVTSAPNNAPAKNNNHPVLVFFDYFSLKKTLAVQIFCKMNFYVKNDSNMQIDENIPPKEVKTIRYALVGPGCYTMGETPSLNITSCLMRSWNNAGKVIDVPENICKNMVTFR